MIQELQSDAEKKAQPYIDSAREKAGDAQKKADELSKEAQKKAQPVFDSANEQYKEAEKQAIAAKDKAVKQATPVLDDAKQRTQQACRFATLTALITCHISELWGHAFFPFCSLFSLLQIFVAQKLMLCTDTEKLLSTKLMLC